MSDAVSYAVVDRVAVVTIERPEVRNAMDMAVFEGLAARAGQAGADPDVGAVLLRGRDGVFSSGIDTSIFAGGPDEGPSRELIHRLQSSFTAFEELEKPSLALVEGHCYGAGLQLALACHLRAVVPGARLALMEVQWGLVPDLGGTYRLPRLVGTGRATELALTGRKVPAADAVAAGLAELELPGDDPEAEALAYLRPIAHGPRAVREIPRLMRENADRPRDEALAAEARVQLGCVAHPDFTEAVTARLEGRAPRFSS